MNKKGIRDTKNNPSPKTNQISRDTLIHLAIESWRLSKTFESLLQKAEINEQKKYKGKLCWFNEKLKDTLKEIDLILVNIEGHRFDTGMAVRAINIDEFEQGENLIVDNMLEPIVLDTQGVVKSGTVILKRA